jgi:hypothetical protein
MTSNREPFRIKAFAPDGANGQIRTRIFMDSYFIDLECETVDEGYGAYGRRVCIYTSDMRNVTLELVGEESLPGTPDGLRRAMATVSTLLDEGVEM